MQKQRIHGRLCRKFDHIRPEILSKYCSKIINLFNSPIVAYGFIHMILQDFLPLAQPIHRV